MNKGKFATLYVLLAVLIAAVVVQLVLTVRNNKAIDELSSVTPAPVLPIVDTQ